jgi:hypothetical protein
MRQITATAANEDEGDTDMSVSEDEDEDEDDGYISEDDIKLNIYHWGTAEKTQLKSHSLKDDTNMILTDMWEVFKTYKVGLPTCFGYGLKEVAHSLHDLGLIETIWPTTMTGGSTLSVIMDAERSCQRGEYESLSQVPSLQEMIKYNEVDCKVIHEIDELIRRGS